MIRAMPAYALLVYVFLRCTSAVEVKVLFFPERDLNGTSTTYRVNVDRTCTDCQGFGDQRSSIWESYVLAAPASSGNYSLALYDSNYCNGKNAVLDDTNGDIPDSLGDQVAAFKVCPPGQSP